MMNDSDTALYKTLISSYIKNYRIKNKFDKTKLIKYVMLCEHLNKYQFDSLFLYLPPLDDAV